MPSCREAWPAAVAAVAISALAREGSERGAGRRIYVCARVPGHDGCGRLSVQAVAVEGQVRDMVIAALAGPGLARALNDHAVDDSEAARLSESLGADEARLDECRTALADGD